MPASLRILEFFKANAGRTAKWKEARGATQGKQGWEGAEQGLERAPVLPPNFSRSKRQVGPGWGLGSGKMRLMVQGARALLGARVPQFPFRNDWARGREERSRELHPLPRGQIGETEEREVTPPWEFGAGGGRDEDSFCHRRYLWRWDSAKGRQRSAGGPVFLRGGGGSGGVADGFPQSPQLNRPALLSPERRDPARQ